MGRRGRAALRALCDAWYPGIAESSADPDTLNRVAAAVEEWLVRHASAGEARQVRWLLTALHAIGFPRRTQRARVAMLHKLYKLPQLRAGLENLRGLAAIHYFGSTTNGALAAWPTIGYPGAPEATDARTETGIAIVARTADRISADVCIVGSGAGGSAAGR